MTGQDPLIRLADELGHLGRRLEAVGQELRHVRVAPAPAPVVGLTPAAEAALVAMRAQRERQADDAEETTPAEGHTIGRTSDQSAGQPTAGWPADAGAMGPGATGPGATGPGAAVPGTAGPGTTVPGAAGPGTAVPGATVPGPAGLGAPGEAVSSRPTGVGAGGWGGPRVGGAQQAAFVPAPPPPPTPWVTNTPFPPPPPRASLFERLGQDGAGSKVLAWVGGAITLLGVVLLLVLAVQRGYLGPVPRVIGGALLGATLIGIGLRIHRTPTARTGAFALAATGFAVLYLDVVAATSIYGYLPEGGGLAAGLAVAAAGLLLAMRWDSNTFAIGVVAACAVAAPILTEGFTPLLVAFLLVLKMAASPVHLKRDWPWLGVAAGVPPLAAILLAMGRVPVDSTALAGVALVAAVIGVAAAVLTVRVRPDDMTALALAVASPMPALLTTVFLDRTQAAGLAGIVAIMMIALWAVGRNALPRAFAAAAGGVGVFALFQATAIALDGSARAAVVLAEALLLTFLAEKLRSRGPLIGSAGFGAVGLALAVAEAVPPALLLDEPWRRTPPGTLVASMLTALVLGLLAVALPWVAYRRQVLAEPAKHPIGWVAAGLVLLYAAAGVVLSAALLVSQDVTGFLFGHSIVTVSWTIAALVLLVRGIDHKPLRVAGLVLVAAAVAKLLLFDLAALDGIARVLAFIGAGLVLLTAGTRYAKLVATRRFSANS